MTGCDPWYDRGQQRAEEHYLDSLIGRMQESRGSTFGAIEPERRFGDPLEPRPPGYSARSAIVGACPYCSHGDPYKPPIGLRPDDIDTIIARLLEGYRVLDELFNPRSARTRSAESARNPRSETDQSRSD